MKKVEKEFAQIAAFIKARREGAIGYSASEGANRDLQSVTANASGPAALFVQSLTAQIEDNVEDG